MKKLIFWTLATVLFAAIGHVATVLYSQLTLQSTAIVQIAENSPANQLVQFDAETAKLISMPYASPDISYSYCSFDISEKPLRIRVSIPSTYWSMAAYTQTGVNFYTISDRQIETRELEIVVTSDRHKDQFETGTTIVSPPGDTGLFLFRAFIPNRSFTEIIQAQMNEVTCTPL